MHLITGLVLTTLLGRKSPKKRSLLRLRGVIETTHLIPGRVRFRVQTLIGNDENVILLQEKLKQIQGIDSVSANKISGSVLIKYQPQIISAELLFAGIVRILNLQQQIKKSLQPLIAKEIHETFQSLNYAIYDATGGIIDLWTALPLLMAGVGIHQLITKPQARFPGGATLLWWAYASLVRNKLS